MIEGKKNGTGGFPCLRKNREQRIRLRTVVRVTAVLFCLFAVDFGIGGTGDSHIPCADGSGGGEYGKRAVLRPVQTFGDVGRGCGREISVVHRRSFRRGILKFVCSKFNIAHSIARIGIFVNIPSNGLIFPGRCDILSLNDFLPKERTFR